VGGGAGAREKKEKKSNPVGPALEGRSLIGGKEMKCSKTLSQMVKKGFHGAGGNVLTI